MRRIVRVVAVSFSVLLVGCGGASIGTGGSGSGSSGSGSGSGGSGAQASGGTWVRAVAKVNTANDIVWDGAHGRLYVSIASTDTVAPNTIATVDPVAGSVTSSTPAATNPDLMSISSDSNYLWVGLDGSGTVQRYLLPGMSPDIAITLPIGYQNKGEQAVALQAAPVNPHTVAIVQGNLALEPSGNGVYVYDDAVQRPSFVPGPFVGPDVDSIQWGADDSVLYGNQNWTIDEGGIATLPVTAAGVTFSSYSGGLVFQMTTPQFNRGTGLLYSYGAAYDPAKLTVAGTFDIPVVGDVACTADSALNRYYCIAASSVGDTDVAQFQLFVYNLTSYSPIDTIYFGENPAGESNGASLSGEPVKLVRWGNAGLAVITQSSEFGGNGGLFLIDGAAINANASPDVSSGTAAIVYPSLSSMSPDFTTGSSGSVTFTITGTGFTPASQACWSCSYIQFRFLPTTYVSPTQLTVTAPVSSLPTNAPAEVSVFNSDANLFSSNALTFTVLPSPTGTTTVTPMNLCGLGMAWDSASQLLYVGTADYDGQYPNSIVALNPSTGAVARTQPVSSDPMYISDGADGEYLYVGYENSTNVTQLSLPDLTTASTAVLANPAGQAWYPGDVKAAPVDPHTWAATLIQPGWSPEALGGVVVYDDNVPRAQSMAGWTGGQTIPAVYDTLAWSATDSLLGAAPADWDIGGGPLYALAVSSQGLSYLATGTTDFNGAGDIHSDFGTGLVYSDNGNVADPQTGIVTGSYGASGIAAPDSSTNRMFILGQTSAQANTDNYTIQSFDEKTFQPVSSITLNNISGVPFEMVRWGSSGLAVLTSGGEMDVYANGFGMLYLVSDTSFVNADSKPSAGGQERVQHYWKTASKRDLAKQIQARATAR